MSKKKKKQYHNDNNVRATKLSAKMGEVPKKKKKVKKELLNKT